VAQTTFGPVFVSSFSVVVTVVVLLVVADVAIVVVVAVIVVVVLWCGRVVVDVVRFKLRGWLMSMLSQQSHVIIKSRDFGRDS
jgi:hypothetical protein